MLNRRINYLEKYFIRKEHEQILDEDALSVNIDPFEENGRASVPYPIPF